MFWQPAPDEFVDDVPHVAGGHELALLHVHGPAGLRGGHQQIGLPGKERGNLQQRAHFADRRGLLRFVDVGRHRQAGRLRDLCQDLQPGLDPGAAIRA